MGSWNALFDQARGFHAATLCGAGASLGLSALPCGPPQPVRLAVYTAGQQFRDCSTAYRLFECERPESGPFIFCTPGRGSTAGGGRNEKTIRFLDQADLEVKSASEYEHGQRR